MGSGCSQHQAGATEPGNIAASRGRSREEGCWLGRCWGGREEHPPSPAWASFSSSPSARAGHGALGPLGWLQFWSPGESSEVVWGGWVGCARTFSIIDNSTVAGSGSGGDHTRWHPHGREGPLSIPGRSRCVGPVSVPGGVEKSTAGWGPYWAHLFLATGEGTARLGGCGSSNKD